MSSKKTTSKATAKTSTSDKKTAKSTPKNAPEKKSVAKVEKTAATEKKAAIAKDAPATAKKTTAKVEKTDAAVKKTVVKKDNPEKNEPAKVVKAVSDAEKKNTAKSVDSTKKASDIKKVEPPVEDAPAKKNKDTATSSVQNQADKNKDKIIINVNDNGKGSENTDKNEKKSVVKSDYPYSVLLDGKKPCKFIMFVEIDEQEERANKKKVTSEMKNLEKKPTSAIRHKISLAEETQEELTERILKELEEQNAAFTREAATQICTRCNRNLVSPEFWVDKHLGYCEECAAILHLGQSKEARKVEYELRAMGGDSLDEVDDDDFEGPDAADLKEAEEFADFDD